jgi:hypothetical protein
MEHVKEVAAGSNVSVVTESVGDSMTKVTVTALSGMTATAAELNKAADASSWTQTLTVSGAVLGTTKELLLNHATVAVEATIATTANHPGLFFVKDISATGTAAHTVTITTGTWDGTNKIITLNALDEAILVWFDAAGNGTIIENVGSVALS